MTTFFVEIAGKPATREWIECSGYKIAAAQYAEFCQALEIGGELELDISLGGRDRPARVVVSHRPDGCFVVEPQAPPPTVMGPDREAAAGTQSKRPSDYELALGYGLSGHEATLQRVLDSRAERQPAAGYIHLPRHALVRAGDEILLGPPGRQDWDPVAEEHIGQRAGSRFAVRRRIRPAPFVGYRWCECGDPIDGHADERVGSLNVFVCRDSMHDRAGGAPSGINGHGYVTRWTADPRLLENRSGATQPSSQMHLVPGVGISAPTKEDPALVVDEQWGEEFER